MFLYYSKVTGILFGKEKNIKYDIKHDSRNLIKNQATGTSITLQIRGEMQTQSNAQHGEGEPQGENDQNMPE